MPDIRNQWRRFHVIRQFGAEFGSVWGGVRGSLGRSLGQFGVEFRSVSGGVRGSFGWSSGQFGAEFGAVWGGVGAVWCALCLFIFTLRILGPERQEFLDFWGSAGIASIAQ